MLVTVSTLIYTALTGIVMIFQACLAAGLPWGAASMGGRYPGKYPSRMRAVALFNILVLLVLALILLTRAGMIFPRFLSFSKMAVWLVVAFSLAGTVMNTVTPSRIERIWAPVAFIQLVASLITALKA